MPSGVYVRTSKIQGFQKGNTTGYRFQKSNTIGDRFQKGHTFRLGILHTEEAKKKIGLASLGRKLSEAAREKIGLSKIGNTYNLGRKLSEATKQKMSGPNNPSWKGGITPEHMAVRASEEYMNWKKSVFERDDYTCKKCNAKNGNGKTIELNAHHIKSFAKYPELRFEVSNGLALCEDCHEKTFKKY